MTKSARMAALATEIIAQKITPELASQANHLVMGDGSLDADIIFIGEAPGKKEDESGLPFVGAAGKFLDAMLTSVNLERKDVYITSIVKYRPPNNRDPLPAEKAAFLPYLIQQLQIIQPKLIIPLGRHGMEYFLPGVRISEIHGELQWIQFDGKRTAVLPLYHPAAALYNGSLRQTLLDDFAKVPAIIERLK